MKVLAVLILFVAGMLMNTVVTDLIAGRTGWRTNAATAGIAAVLSALVLIQ